mmetsp:Transcript_94934/g.163767  ORF Transcript_94934/g.163767 Transcript_94934/m.163767 type:complete len:96 (+) Transcript_94934:3337-3624(+)
MQVAKFVLNQGRKEAGEREGAAFFGNRCLPSHPVVLSRKSLKTRHAMVTVIPFCEPTAIAHLNLIHHIAPSTALYVLQQILPWASSNAVLKDLTL